VAAKVWRGFQISRGTVRVGVYLTDVEIGVLRGWAEISTGFGNAQNVLLRELATRIIFGNMYTILSDVSTKSKRVHRTHRLF
jgi:hypothetical protein